MSDILPATLDNYYRYQVWTEEPVFRATLSEIEWLPRLKKYAPVYSGLMKEKITYLTRFLFFWYHGRFEIAGYAMITFEALFEKKK